MRHIYLFIIIAFISKNGIAQNDTLLWEDFEAETIDYILNDYPTGDPNLSPNYLNFDLDGVEDGSDSDRPGEWFLSFGFADVDSTNTVLASNSWLQGEVDGAENWLVLPRLDIVNDQAVLQWKSAPFQLPRYMDGYQVLVSTETNIETDFADTLAVFAEFDGNLTTDYEDTTTYVFTYGTMHTELEYDPADITRHGGVLQQWQVSLASYSGQQIFIAFRHRSDDDNLISIDDLLVLGDASLSVSETESFSDVTIYPNPVSIGDFLTLDYMIESVSAVEVQVHSVDGKLVCVKNGHTQVPGPHKMRINVEGMVPGRYVVSLLINGEPFSKRFVVEN